MTSATFNFEVLRVTVAQILRGIGFDRCAPSLIDILTDLYIRHLQLLAEEADSLAHAAGEPEIRIQDITQALQNVGMLKPTNVLDVYDEYDGTNKGCDNFLLWVVGSVPENARTVARPTAEMLDSNKLKPSPVIPEYINTLKNNHVTAGEGELDGATAAPVPSSVGPEHARAESEQPIEEDWLKFVMRKQTKLGHEDRFKNTVLNTVSLNSHSDHLVHGPTPEHLLSKLPYHRNEPSLESMVDSNVSID